MNLGKLKKTVATLTISTVLLSSTSILSMAVNNTATTSKAPATQNNQGFRGGRGQFDIKPVLDKLVKAKTITAAQETKIIAYQKKQAAARQAEMAKFKNMTEDQRKQAFAKQKQPTGTPNKQSQYADLVKNKTLTQKQADAVDKAVAAARPSFGGRMGNNNQGNNNQGNN